jgi:Uri superfamily endonuclease
MAARIRHHRKIATRPHWHIDYLRVVCDLVEVWFTTDPTNHEHVWAKALARVPGVCQPMPGFGSSDCKCDSHLFWWKGITPVVTVRQSLKPLVFSLSGRRGRGG